MESTQLTVCIVSLTSFFIDVRIKWKTILRISVSSPLRFIATSKVCFISSLQTSGEHASFYKEGKFHRLKFPVSAEMSKVLLTPECTTHLNSLEEIAVNFHLFDVLGKLQRCMVNGRFSELLHGAGISIKSSRIFLENLHKRFVLNAFNFVSF